MRILFAAFLAIFVYCKIDFPDNSTVALCIKGNIDHEEIQTFSVNVLSRLKIVSGENKNFKVFHDVINTTDTLHDSIQYFIRIVFDTIYLKGTEAMKSSLRKVDSALDEAGKKAQGAMFIPLPFNALTSTVVRSTIGNAIYEGNEKEAFENSQMPFIRVNVALLDIKSKTIDTKIDERIILETTAAIPPKEQFKELLAILANKIEEEIEFFDME